MLIATANTIRVWKFNPYHDKGGRFASGGSGGDRLSDLGNEESAVQEGKAWVSSLNAGEHASVESHTFWSTGLNETLRRGNKEETSRYQKRIDGLDTALTKATTTKDYVVYRGEARPGLGKELKGSTGKLMTDRAYGSTTMSEYKAGKFAALAQRSRGSTETAIYEIRVPKGAHAAWLHQVSVYAKEPEHELLLPRNSVYHVVSVVESKSGVNRHYQVVLEYRG